VIGAKEWQEGLLALPWARELWERRREVVDSKQW
jgi:hypothetical protein